MRNVQRLLKGGYLDWYEAHKNTAALVQAVASSINLQTLSGDQIWQLMRLTWITNNGEGVSPNHWQTLKVPALASLFERPVPNDFDDLGSAIRQMGLPRKIETAASRDTGTINFRYVWRNTAREWCSRNRAALKTIILAARSSHMKREKRSDLAARIESLPPIPSPNDRATVRAVMAVSPLVAFLDPQHRFPIINGRHEVEHLLAKLGLSNRNLEDQIYHLDALIGQFGVTDAFLLDIFADRVSEMAARVPSPESSSAKPTSETHLPNYDLDERRATQKARTTVYHNRHNKMTEALKRLFAGYELLTSYDHNCNYDVLVKNYDRKERDLLIEAKPDPESGAIRIAIGQLLDYRRFLARPAATDLALLTITPPSLSHMELLDELQITALWFPDESCRRISGEGRDWPTVRGLQAQSRR